MTGVVIAALFAGMDYVIHGKILAETYRATAQFWRAPEIIQSKMWIGGLGYVYFGILFAVLYAAGFDPAKPAAGQGTRFGILIGLFFWGGQLLLSYPYQPWPDDLYRAWFGIGFGECVLLGLVIEKIYYPGRSA